VQRWRGRDISEQVITKMLNVTKEEHRMPPGPDLPQKSRKANWKKSLLERIKSHDKCLKVKSVN
jgi:hypothetical protein